MTQPQPLPSSFAPDLARARAPRPRRRRRGGFTMIEIITVAVIIMVLMAIALPMLSRTMKQGRKTRAAADLATIGTGLDAYRTDFGDYPRTDQNNVGFALLGKAMVGPGPGGGPLSPLGAAPYHAGDVSHTGTPGPGGNYQEYVCFGRPDGSGGFTTNATQADNTQWQPFPVSDGKDGPGLRARIGGGQSFGPYIQPEKFRLRGLAILDLWENPILYFPARPKKPVPATAGDPWPLIQPGPAALYNADLNPTFFLRPNENLPADAAKALARMDAVLVKNSTDFDGFVEAAEQAAADKPFLLWSAGADGNFGPTYDTAANPTAEDIRKVDDVTNFTTGQ